MHIQKKNLSILERSQKQKQPKYAADEQNCISPPPVSLPPDNNDNQLPSKKLLASRYPANSAK
jgi:hypothetical protein